MSDSCDPIEYSPPGSPIHGILQARILEWVAISFARGSSQPKDQTQVSCITGKFFTVWATSALVLSLGWDLLATWRISHRIQSGQCLKAIPGSSSLMCEPREIKEFPKIHRASRSKMVIKIWFPEYKFTFIWMFFLDHTPYSCPKIRYSGCEFPNVLAVNIF